MSCCCTAMTCDAALLCMCVLCASQRAYRDHQAEKRMKDLIAEEEEAGRLEDERAAARAAADKEKRAKKKERKKVRLLGVGAKRNLCHTFTVNASNRCPSVNCLCGLE